MPHKTRIVAPGPSDRSVRTGDGQILHAPADWELLPPGDAGLTRRVKASGPTWTVQEKKGRKTFSRGIWAPAARIATIRAELEAERSTDAYAKRRAADSARRERKQTEYVEDFRGAVLAFLDFAPCYAGLAEQLADAVTQHATPVGSGTVARTQRIRYNAKHDVFLALVREVADWPGPVYIHCAQGHGRTGTLAAAVLLAKGHCDSVDAALARLRAARPRLALGKAQLQFVRRIGDQVLPVQKSAGTPPIADSAAGGLTVRDEQAQR